MCLCVVVGGGWGGHEGPLGLERHFEGAARDERTPPGIPASQPVDAPVALALQGVELRRSAAATAAA